LRTNLSPVKMLSVLLRQKNIFTVRSIQITDTTGYAAWQILEQLDALCSDFQFPMLDNGHVYPVASRLSAYRNEQRWAIIIEVVGFHYRAGGHNGINNALHVFGNLPGITPGISNSNILGFTADSEEGEAFDEHTGTWLNPAVHSILLREKKIALEHDPEYYHSKNILLEEPGRIMIWEYLRGIADTHREAMLATEEEIRQRIPVSLPLFLRLDDWHHPDLANEATPGKNETFGMLADAIETGDLSVFKPASPSNTHWKNWPEGGRL